MGIKIIIVGGSVAGLSLANMLEKFDIDYTILEAYSQIAPQVGASIGLLPNGLRILDQLGCYERLREAAGNYYHRVVFRDAKGKPISSSPGPTISERMEKHAGYASLWVDRQMLLQILYDNLKQKDRVLTNRRVVHVETSSTGVVVKTEDGSTYAGDILVGGDGVHSKVRQEMWRIASVSDPTAFPPEERSIVQSSMKCIFGISKQPANFPPGATQQSSFFRGHLYLVISAPGGRVYWFLFHELDGTKHGKDIPKFSKDDELLLATRYRDDHITEDMTFGDLYDNRIKSTLVPLEEHVFRRWHFQRILIIGDAATKVLRPIHHENMYFVVETRADNVFQVHPIAAQGGNGAIEAAANLVNALTRSEIPSSPDLQLEFIEKALGEVCTIRYERASSMMKKGRRDGSFLCQQPPFSGILIHYVLPWLGDDLFFKEVLKQSLAGPRIEKLPAPERPHTTPYNDELPQASAGSSWFGWTTGTLAVVTLGMVVHLAQSTGRLAWMARSR
ncbi:hypothetical protein K4K53_009155 [Colletotrichum sp. SAR 10_77]|nr:hypothetical protein K4K51_003867 [Colletotrichum sp. SAR 10_75]KAI8254465.1 hypothetical protein K4K53_009155 [Colletotrichum sp. SAR 10_77]KAJ5007361.1 hypothetical protein K4K48_000212 [Colletotrichum sp. SAR 10_66]